MRARRGTKAASSVTAVNSPLAPSLSSLTRMNITAWPAMRTNLPHGAPAVKRSVDIEENNKKIWMKSERGEPGLS